MNDREQAPRKGAPYEERAQPDARRAGLYGPPLVERLEAVPDMAAESRLGRELASTWRVPRGLVGFFSVVDHRSVGRRFIVTAFGFFTLAGILAALMRQSPNFVNDEGGNGETRVG